MANRGERVKHASKLLATLNTTECVTLITVCIRCKAVLSCMLAIKWIKYIKINREQKKNFTNKTYTVQIRHEAKMIVCFGRRQGERKTHEVDVSISMKMICFKEKTKTILGRENKRRKKRSKKQTSKKKENPFPCLANIFRIKWQTILRVARKFFDGNRAIYGIESE